MLDKTCLKCGYERTPSDEAPAYKCPKCGAIYDYDKMNSAKKNNRIPRINNSSDIYEPITSKKSILVLILAFVPAMLLIIFSDTLIYDPVAWVGRKTSELSSEISVVGWVIIASIFMVAVFIIKTVIISKNKKRMEEKLSQLKDFTSTQKAMGEDGKSGLAIDEDRKKICLIKQENWKIDYRVIPCSDLLSSEIYEDGTTITKTSRSSQLGGALIGGIALGGIGALLGGLSGKKKSSDNVKRIDLRITVNKTDAPVHDVNFMNVECKKGSRAYNDAIRQANHWHGLIKVLIRRADEEDKENKGGIKGHENRPVADELIKLAQLQEQGILSESEFKEQKARLLSTN